MKPTKDEAEDPKAKKEQPVCSVVLEQQRSVSQPAQSICSAGKDKKAAPPTEAPKDQMRVCHSTAVGDVNVYSRRESPQDPRAWAPACTQTQGLTLNPKP